MGSGRAQKKAGGDGKGRGGGRKRNQPVWRRVKRVLSIVAPILLGGVLLFAVYFAVLLHRAGETVENVSEIMAHYASRPTVFVSADGTRLAEFRTEYRSPATLAEIPKRLQDATIAAEDKRFWNHPGIDPIGMARAGWVMLRGGPVQGGSTLPQQLAKDLYTTKERTISRKLEDMALAIQLEKRLTKEQILELYLNQVYYGSGAYGARAAADVYFGKTLDDLTLAECATLARLPRRPSGENPFVNREAALRNREVVLDLMFEQGYISQSERDAAKKETLRLAQRRPAAQADWKAPYAVAEVMRELKDVLDPEDLYAGGYTVELTINYDMQEIAERAVRKVLRDHRSQNVRDGAAVLIDLRGRTLAMVGGSDFKRSQFNVVTQGRRQPGSSFKPMLYAIAFELGVLSPSQHVSDSRRTYTVVGGPPYTPRNSNGVYHGWVSVRTALKHSYNSAAVYANSLVTPRRAAAEIQERFGFRSKIAPVLSLPLGASAVAPIEMAEAYTVFATGGDRIRPYLVQQVTAPDGTVVYGGRPKVFRHVLGRDAAEDMDSILRDAVRSGTGTRAASVPGARGKTGTTSDYRDAWFIGYSGDYLCVTWVGNPVYDEAAKRWVYEPMRRVFGGTVPILAWRQLMNGIDDLPNVNLGEASRGTYTPPGVTTVRICLDSGQLATRNCPETEEREFATGTEPTASCPLHPVATSGPEVVVLDMDDVANLQGGRGDNRAPPPPGRSGSVETVRIYVCEESGLPANPYCPYAVPKEFPKDRVPRGVCRIHGP